MAGYSERFLINPYYFYNKKKKNWKKKTFRAKVNTVCWFRNSSK